MGSEKRCFSCGNRGPKEGVCPECGREAKKLNLAQMTPQQLQKVMVKMSDSHIPGDYIERWWSSEMFRKYKGLDADWKDSQGRKDLALEKYVRSLDALHEQFVQGMFPAQSVFIIAPATYSKVTFAYSCMQHAIVKGFTVAPILDTIDLNRLLVLAGENPKYKWNKKLDYEDYINAEVCFVTVTKTPYAQGAALVIDELLSRRSRLGLSTFILSRFDPYDLSRWDKTGNFRRMSRATLNDNPKKYPAIIKYEEWGQ